MGKEREYQVDTSFYLYKNVIKRILDISVSLVALIVLLIPFVIISLLIKLDSKGPVFFKQVRMGKDDVPFDILKFRSMYETAPHQMSTSQLDNPSQHVTTIGKFLRKTSLDELPQLINVIKGDMSIVGPRPVVKEELNEYGNRVDKFLSVKPGAMGLWQSSGRSNIGYPERCDVELSYVDKASYWFDIQIMFKNIISIFKSEGAY